MNLVILTSYSSRHYYFLNAIRNEFGEVNCFVVQEPKSSISKNLSFIKKIKRQKYKFKIASKILINLLYGKYAERVNIEKIKEEESYFGNVSDFQKLSGGSSFMKLSLGETINAPKVLNWIKSKDPDLLIVMGTSLLKSKLVRIPTLGTLNLHTGISPYYRGGMTNLWPIVNREPQFCGVTIHELNLKIDAGRIIHTGQPRVEENDNFSRINSKSIILGTEFMIKSIEQVLKNQVIEGVEQWTNGKLFYNIDYNGVVAKKYLHSLKCGVISDYCKVLTKQTGEKTNQPRLVERYIHA